MCANSEQRRERTPLARSRELQERAAAVIPYASQTGSKRLAQFVQGISPSHIERAAGARLWDPDGNEYIDCNASLGPIILGHNHPAVRAAVSDQLEDGTVFTMEHPLQVGVAEAVTEMVPCAEMVKFAKNGNDVTTLAAKLARASTGRNVIATQGYHGWTDTWTCANQRIAAGIPDKLAAYTKPFEYNDIESVEEIFANHPDDVAAILTNPVNNEPPEDGFLEDLRDLAHDHGALLVFDEVLTGFQAAPGGAQERFDVIPDLACFAKAMANGYPFSALAGRREVMRHMEADDFSYSMTNAGEAASLAAAAATLEILREEPVHDHIREHGRRLREGYNDLAAEHGLETMTEASGFDERFSIGFDVAESDGPVRSLFMQAAHSRGVLFTGSHMPTYSHTDVDIDRTLAVYDDCLNEVKTALDAGDVADRPRGDPIGSTLRQRWEEPA